MSDTAEQPPAPSVVIIDEQHHQLTHGHSLTRIVVAGGFLLRVRVQTKRVLVTGGSHQIVEVCPVQWEWRAVITEEIGPSEVDEEGGLFDATEKLEKMADALITRAARICAAMGTFGPYGLSARETETLVRLGAACATAYNTLSDRRMIPEHDPMQIALRGFADPKAVIVLGVATHQRIKEST